MVDFLHQSHLNSHAWRRNKCQQMGPHKQIKICPEGVRSLFFVCVSLLRTASLLVFVHSERVSNLYSVVSDNECGENNEKGVCV